MKINQETEIKIYMVPTIGEVSLKQGQFIKDDSDLGKKLKSHYPQICGESKEELLVEEPVTIEPMKVETKEEPKVEEPKVSTPAKKSVAKKTPVKKTDAKKEEE